MKVNSFKIFSKIVLIIIILITINFKANSNDFENGNDKSLISKNSLIGSLSIYFFYFNQQAENIEIEIKPVVIVSDLKFKDTIIIPKTTLKDGIANFKLTQGEYQLRYKFKDKLSKYQEFNVYPDSQTQIIVSYDDYEYNVKVDHPKTIIEKFYEKKVDLKANELSISDNKDLVEIKGRVVDKIKFKPVPNVNLLIANIDINATTDKLGRFILRIPKENIKSNQIEISAIHQTFATFTEKYSLPLKYKEIEIALQPSGIALDQITVVAPHIKGSVSSMLNQRKSSLSVKDLLGSEQMSKSGDSSAASALRRVTGLSLVDGKYIYVRGLGERYSSTLLNGSQLPSPDPSRRVVPLDMFPSALIESIEVQKTYSSDQILEFGGGVVNISTKSIPDKRFARMSVSTGVSSEGVLSGNEQGIFHSDSGSDWTGFDLNNIRQMPKALQDVIAQNRDINTLIDDDPFAVGNGEATGFTGEEIEALGESFSRNYNIKEESLPANFGMNFEIGDKFKRGNIFKLGGTAKLAYSNATDTDLITQRRVDMVSSNEGVVSQEDSNTETENIVNLGGILGFGVELFKNNEINFTQVLTRSTLNSTLQIERDAKNNIDDTANIYRLRWQERELNTSQINGVHKLTSSDKGPKIVWNFTNSQAKLDEPDYREYYYLNVNDQLLFADDKVYGNERSFSSLKEDLNDFKINYETTTRLKTSSTAFMDLGFKVGFQNIKKDREFNVRRFKFRNESTSGSSVAYDREDSLDDILSDENIRPGGFRLIDSTLPTDNYFAQQDINAVFMQASNTFNFRYDTKNGSDYFKPQIVYGLRLERSNQVVNTFDLNSTGNEINTNLDTSDLLPSVGLNFAINAKHTLRFGFTKTVSRPDFKELSPARFLNDDDNIYERGNPDLIAASISNFDFRWDWYPTSKELISVGVFMKNFENPIEAYAVNSTDDIRSFRNISEATNSGIEFEIRKDITEFIGAGFNTEIFSNYSLIASQVQLSAEEKGNSTSSDRPLQGQSPFLLNFGIDMTMPWYNLNTTLVYNIVGKRITDVGDGGRPDTYEQPIHQLDLSLIQKIKKNMNLTFRAQNLLDPDITRTQGEFVVSNFQRGRAFSLGVSAVF